MRPRLALALALAWTMTPRIAAACSWDHCFDLGRWQSVELHSVAPIPRDGAIVFRAQGSWHSCLSHVADELDVLVTRAGEPVPGEVVQYVGLDDTFVWRPADLLVADATYKLHITLDNAAIAETVEGGLYGKCGPDQLVVEFSVLVGSDLTVVPELAPPDLAAEPVILDTDLRGVACCPDTTPEWSNGSCEADVYWWPMERCTLLHGLTAVRYAVTPPTVSAVAARQYAWQLRIDGKLVARDLDPAVISALHATTACARFEALHLATGEVVTSLDACPTPELAATLGPHSIADELPCADAVLCADTASTWEGNCTPYDPLNPPTPPDWTVDTVLDVVCPDAIDASDLDEPPADTPTTGPGDPDTSDTATTDNPDTASETDRPDRGCTCTHAPTPAPLWLLALLLLPRRSRRA